jgi:hypothetical protein
MAQKPPRRREVQRLPGAVIGQDAPAVERGGDLPAERAVGGDKGGGDALLGGGAQAHGDGQRLAPRVGRLEQGDVLHRPGDVGERRAVAQPLIGDRRGPQRQRHEPVARGAGRRGVMPGADGVRRDPGPVHEAGKAELRVILGHHRIGQGAPDMGGRVEIEARQHHRPLRQPRHRLHQHMRRPARAGRPGDDHGVAGGCFGPGRDERLDHAALARLCVGRVGAAVEEGSEDAEKGLDPCPVPGLIRDVEGGDGLGGDTLAVHLVDEFGEAVGEAEDGTARRDIGRAVEQRRDELRQFQLPPQARGGGRQAARLPAFAEIGDEAQTWQKAGRPVVEDVAQAAGHAAGVDDDLYPRQRLGGRIAEPCAQAVDERAGKIHAGREAEDAWGGISLEHGRISTCLRPARCPRGGRHRTSAPGRLRRKGGPRRRARPTHG